MKIKPKISIRTTFLSVLLLAAMVVPQIVQTIGALSAIAAESTETIATYFFRRQLENNNQRAFYSTMQTMLETGLFKKGNASMEVMNLSFTNDEKALVRDFGVARDAFMLDYPDLFYVDFDYLSIRGVTEDKKTTIYLGTGRGNSYINKEFQKADGSTDTEKLNAAIEAVNAQVKEIVDYANGGTTVRDKVKRAHDRIIKRTAYKYEYESKLHPYAVRTVYGALGVGEALCEGFARALKTVLDRLDIPTVLVIGIYKNGDRDEPHMWNYVQENGIWYGVDATFDNNKDSNDDAPLDTYLMVTGNKMENHIPTGIVSTSEKEFFYPGLETITSADDRTETNVVYADEEGFIVEKTDITKINGHDVTEVYKVSYKGRGFYEAAKDGNYILIDLFGKFLDNGSGNVDEYATDWQYPLDVGEPYDGIYQDCGQYVLINTSNNTNGMRVGLTKIPPQRNDKGEYDVYSPNFHDNEDGTGVKFQSPDVITSGEIHEHAAPYIKSASPALNTKYTVGRTYHITVTYDQPMHITSADGKIGVDYQFHDLVYGYRKPKPEEALFSISEPQLSEDRTTITFDLTPSKQWTYDETAYVIQFTDIVGDKSDKVPNHVPYIVYNPTTGCIYQLRAMGIDMDAYGKPTLVDDFDLSSVVNSIDELGNISEEWLAQYGDLLKHRISLVTTSVDEEKRAALGDQLGKLDSSVDTTKVEFYNISLSLCLCQLERLKDGTHLRVRLGFPLGYGPEDAGTTFKAYHYALQEDGTYQIEEIPCTVTELGLIIEVESFSPFAIAAVPIQAVDGNIQNISVNIVNGKGTVTATNKIDAADTNSVSGSIIHNYYTVKNGDVLEKKFDTAANRELEFTPADGYQIEKVTVIENGNEVEKTLTNNKLSVNYGSTVNVSFIANNPGDKYDGNGNQVGGGTQGGIDEPGDDQDDNKEKPSLGTPDTGITGMIVNAIARGGLYISLVLVATAGIFFIVRKETKEE